MMVRHVKMPPTVNGRVRHVLVTRPTVPSLHLLATVPWHANGIQPLLLVSPFHSSPRSLLVAPSRLNKCVLSIMAASGMVTTVSPRQEQPLVRLIRLPAITLIQRLVTLIRQLAVPIQRLVARHLQPAKHPLHFAQHSTLCNVLLRRGAGLPCSQILAVSQNSKMCARLC